MGNKFRGKIDIGNYHFIEKYFLKTSLQTVVLSVIKSLKIVTLRMAQESSKTSSYEFAVFKFEFERKGIVNSLTAGNSIK